jgi:hypothetical protein
MGTFGQQPPIMSECGLWLLRNGTTNMLIRQHLGIFFGSISRQPVRVGAKHRFAPADDAPR